MNRVWTWITDGAHWQGQEGVPTRLVEHLEYSFLAVAVAALIAVPVGLYVGHTGRARFLAINLSGALRAVPSLGLLYIALLYLSPGLRGDSAYLIPTEIVLVVLAVPPVLAGVYAGVEQVEPAARDAARGTGMTGGEVLRKVEVPIAMPLMISGLRSAMLQVVATATLAAVVPLGGLGRFIIDGLAQQDYGQAGAGAVLVTLLALVIDLMLALVQRVVVSPGLTGKTVTGKTVRKTVSKTGRRAHVASTQGPATD